MKTALAGLLTILIATGYLRAEPVFIDTGSTQGQGFGFRIDGECTIISAAHVVGDLGNEVLAYTADGQRFELEVAHADPEWDVAVMRIAERIDWRSLTVRPTSRNLSSVCSDRAANFHDPKRYRGPFRDRGRARTGLQLVRVFGMAGEAKDTPLNFIRSEDKGDHFWVAPRGEANILEGYSGSLVWRASSSDRTGSPVGMITHVGDGEALGISMAKLEETVVALVAPISDIVIQPQGFTLDMVTRGKVSKFQTNIHQDPRTRALTLVISAGEKHRVLSGFRLHCSFACKVSVTLEASLDHRDWQRIRLYRQGGRGSRKFAVADRQAFISLRVSLLGEITSLKGVTLNLDP